jgi:TolA-binding protein
MRIVALLTLLSGCFAHNGEVAASMHSALDSATSRLQMAESQVSSMRDRIDQMETVIREQGLNHAGRLENVDQVAAAVATMRGELEVLRFDVDALRSELERYELDQERRQLHDEIRLEQVEVFLGLTAPPAPDLGAPAPPPPAGTPTELPQTPRAKLSLAVTHMEADRQPVARAVLEQALRAHPNVPETAEIRYRIAETWFNEKEWSAAAKAFDQVVKKHETSDWAPWARVRQGECFASMNQPDGARLFWEDVVKRWPASDAAEDARKRIR